jgi:GNAT superfamily N-acetyltransferase
MSGITFRTATPDDAEQLSTLLGELGYPTPASEIPARLAALTSFEKSLALVAARENEAVGLITVIIFPSIHARDPVSLITSLVVSSEVRGHGIGSSLVARAEEWAAENGAGRLTVGSGLQREETHLFYEQRGYKRSGIRFAKMLKENPAR